MEETLGLEATGSASQYSVKGANWRHWQGELVQNEISKMV
jgi:hypothetical protein